MRRYKNISSFMLTFLITLFQLNKPSETEESLFGSAVVRIKFYKFIDSLIMINVT
jgi:hypothetical protein